jgi:hypothetical protein
MFLEVVILVFNNNKKVVFDFFLGRLPFFLGRCYIGTHWGGIIR